MTNATPQKPIAGWYPDPSGTGMLREWDGGQWTERLVAAEQLIAVAETTNLGAGYGEERAYQQDPAYQLETNIAEQSFELTPEQLAAQSSAQAPAQAMSSSGVASFFRNLFDFSFDAERSVTTSFAKIIYIFFIAVCALGWIGSVVVLFVLSGIASAASSYYGGGPTSVFMTFGVLALLFGWIPALLNVIIVRVALEFVTAQIRTSQHAAELVRLGQAAATHEGAATDEEAADVDAADLAEAADSALSH